MTPAEALARAVRTAPNVTGHVVREFAGAPRGESLRAARMLADTLGQITGVAWQADEVSALADAIAAGPEES